MTDLIDRHLKACRAAGLAESTTDAREEFLRRLHRELPWGIDKATTEELQEWLGRRSWAPKTRETYWCHLTAFYRWAVTGRVTNRGISRATAGRVISRRSQVLDYDPSADLPRPRVGRHLPRVATDDQLAHALANLTRPVLRAVILAAGVGMRAGEVAVAEREHITEHRVLIHGKGDKMRSVPVPPDVWAEVRDAPPGRLILSRAGPVTADWVTETVSDALTQVGLPRLSLHWFRGSYATRLNRAGASVPAIARLMGHSSVATTQLYIETIDHDLDLAVAKLPPLPVMGHEPDADRLVPTAEAA